MKKPFFIISLVIYTLIILYLSLSKPNGLTDIGTWDKWAHATAYVGFSLQAGFIANSYKQYLLWIIGFMMFGVLIEGLQSLTSYRDASIADEFANIYGLLTGSIIVIAIKTYLAKRK